LNAEQKLMVCVGRAQGHCVHSPTHNARCGHRVPHVCTAYCDTPGMCTWGIKLGGKTPFFKCLPYADNMVIPKLLHDPENKGDQNGEWC